MINNENISHFREENKMSSLISGHYDMLNILSRFNIALGFGEKSIKEVCKINNVDCDTFIAVVNLILYGGANSTHFVTKELKFRLSFARSLVGYLKSSHNYFLDFKFPIIRNQLEKALSGGGKDLARLIMRYFDDYVAEVKKHMEYENEVIFPYSEQLIGNKLNNTSTSIYTFSEQHSDIQTKLSELKDIIIKYYPAHSTNELNSVLYDIFVCAKDLESHNEVEDKLLIPIIESIEKEKNIPPTKPGLNGKKFHLVEAAAYTS